jgi:dihydroflavonol-4-reductase
MKSHHSLITGATGFIGARLVERLIAQGHTVTCLARARADTARLLQTGATIITGDVTQPATLAPALEKSTPDTVFHLAGVVKAVKTRDFSDVNSHGVENIAAACAARPTAPVLLVVSSLAAGGPAPSDGSPLTEDAPPHPVSAYGKSKFAGEQAALRFANRVPITIVRPPIVYGPGDLGVFEIFAPIARLRTHLIPGYRDARFSLVFVDDLVDALIIAAQKGERLSQAASTPPGQGIYYAAGDETPTYAQLGSAIATALGQRPPRMLRVPKPLLKLAALGADTVSCIVRRSFWLNSDKIIEATAGDWTCLAAKARDQLGWRPAAPLADRLHQTALWYRQNKWL